MATPNEMSVLSGNGDTTMRSAKRKSPRKTGASPKEQAAAPKRSISRSSGPVETLFTQEPNPLREPIPPYLWIDYPTQSEILRSPAYCVRLGVGGADLVEISIDKSPWLPCRLTSGYWWYDWSNIAMGKHTLIARMRTADGRWFKTPPRACEHRPG